jgi:hypothetical protein
VRCGGDDGYGAAVQVPVRRFRCRCGGDRAGAAVPVLEEDCFLSLSLMPAVLVPTIEAERPLGSGLEWA